MIILKAKNEEKFKKIYFDFVQMKNSFAHFWKIKMNIKQIAEIGDFLDLSS